MLAGVAFPGRAMLVMVRQGLAVKTWRGPACNGETRRGMAGEAGSVVVSRCLARCVPACRGKIWCVHGEAGLASPVP